MMFRRLPALTALVALSHAFPLRGDEQPATPAALPAEQVEGAQRPGGVTSTITRPIGRIWRWSDARVRGVFDDILPDVQEKSTWRLSVHPRVRDLIDKDYMRMPVNVQYGYDKFIELEFGVDGYFDNPWENGNGSGISSYRPGVKYRWKSSLDKKISAATGLSMVRPIVTSPAELNQGINRYSTFISLARPINSSENMEGFVNLSYDLVTPSSALGSIAEDQPQDDSTKLVVGMLHHHGRLTFGVSTSWAHTVDGPAADFVSLTPSISFDVPPKYVWNMPGRWKLGAAIEGRHWGSEFAVVYRIRARWSFDFRKAYKDWRENRRAKSDATREAAENPSRE